MKKVMMDWKNLNVSDINKIVCKLYRAKERKGCRDNMKICSNLS